MNFNREDYMSSQEIKDFISYFNGEVKITSKNKERFIKEINLEKAINIFESNMLIMRKIYELTRIYKNSEAIKKAFLKLQKYRDDEFLKDYCEKIEEISEYLKEAEDKDLILTSEFLIENEQTFNYYDEVEGLIDRYIKSDKDFLSDFLADEDISRENLEYCKEIIQEYDPFKALLVEEKELERSRNRRYEARKNIRDIYSGITTGKTRSYLKFDELECYNHLPFKNINQLNELIQDFGVKNAPSAELKFKNLLNGIEPDKAQTILKYFIDNKIIINNEKRTSIKEIEKENVIVNGIRLTEDDKKVMVRYIDVRQTPLYTRAIKLLRDKVLAKEISLDQDKNIRMIRK